MDKTKEHILGVASNFFEKSLSDDYEDDNCLNKFIDREDCLLLVISSDDDDVFFQNKMDLKSDRSTLLVFYKNKGVSLKASNFHQVLQMTSISANSPVEHLYASMKQLYLPIIPDSNGQKNQHLMSFLKKLEAMVEGKDAGDVDEYSAAGDSDATPNKKMMSSLSNEMDYWSGQSRSSKKAKSVRDTLSQACKEYEDLSCSQSLDEVEDVVSMVVDLLDEIWRMDDSPFSEERMRRLMNSIGNDLQQLTSNLLSRQKIWDDVTNGHTEEMSKTVTVCRKWVKECEQLTKQFWKNFPEHAWRGATVDFEDLEDYCEHLKKLLAIKSSVVQASMLLSTSEKNDLNLSTIFSDNFKKTNMFRVDKQRSGRHGQIFENFNNRFKEVEGILTQKLRQRIKDLHGNHTQLLKEVATYKDLMARKNVSGEMQFEKEQLVAGLIQTLDQSIEGGIEALRRDKVPVRTKNNTLLVNKMLELQLLEAKLQSIQQLDGMLLEGLPGSQKLSKKAAECSEDLKSLKTDSFLEWTRDCQQFFNHISKDNEEDLIKLNWSHGKLQVTSGEKLITMAREAKTLTALGYQLPKNISDSLKQAQKFQKYAIILKQIAHFHNSIEQQILPCHKPIMLQSALAFEKLVSKYKKGSSSSSSSSSIEWSHRSELEGYVERLENSANKFMKEITILRKTHNNIHKKVIELMNTDMLRCLPVWKSQLASIRLSINSLINQGFQVESMKLWKHHWDVQLYKALEHQYQKGLVAFNEHAQEIRVELVFKGQQIEFRPPIEEMRGRYYKGIKMFSTIPMLFKGVGDNANSSLFLPMIERSSEHLFKCYSQAEQLFRKLAHIPNKYRSWVVLGTVDMEQLIQSNLREVKDWEDNLRMVKEKSKEVDKLPNELREACVLISLIPLKLAIESQLQRLFDSLVVTLKRSVTSHLLEVENFMEESNKVFDTAVSTFDDISAVNAKHVEIITNLGKVQETFKLIDEKNTLLNSLMGEGVEGLDGVMSGWIKFEGKLNGQREKMKDEMEMMKSNTGFKCKEFENQVSTFKKKWAHLRQSGNEDDDDMMMKKKKRGLGSFEDIQLVKEMTSEFEDLKKCKNTLSNECDLFRIEKPNLKSYTRLEGEMSGLSDVSNDLVLLQSEIAKYEENVWLTYRSKYFAFDSCLDEWTERLVKHSNVTFVNGIVQELRFYKQLLPLLKWVRGDAFSNENWIELFALMDLPNPSKLSPNDLTFGHIIKQAHQISARIEPIKELNSKAQSEVVIRDALRELDGWGSSAVFTMAPLNSADDRGKEVMVIKEWKEVFNKIGEFQSLVQSLKNSGHYKYFQDKVSLWENRLADLDFIIHHLNEIQRRWVYLEPVFNQGTLKGEEGRFKRVDEEFRKLLVDMKRDPKVMSLLFKISLKASLANMLDQLQRCQKTLNAYLEAKRLSFPRFYFIGDDDLLEILGQSKNPSVIQNHLKKLFAGIYNVHFDGAFKKIVAMESSDEEVVKLQREVVIDSDVEVWLSSLTQEMKATLRQSLNSCLAEQSTSWNKYPAQVLSIAAKVSFTLKCEGAISRQALMELHADLKKQLAYYTDTNMQIKNAKNEQADTGGTSVMELKLKDLVFDTIHHVEVVEVLMKRSVKSTQDWYWQKQLRFYNNSSSSSSSSSSNGNSCKIMMGDPEMRHQFEYTYEYQGNTAKLVHTPLTDKCYLTLTLALMNGLGGNPYGPAGTGKTESVKALGGLFGRQVLVFNCDEGIDIKSMGRIFTGLVQCGAWGCFDEFNRLEEAVLSAVSTQIQLIQNAVRIKASTLELLGKTVRVDQNMGIFITMNPASKDYGGRQKLPENLKQLFRPVSMSKPDNRLISEVSLYSEGFKHAKVLASKLISLFSLCRKLLSRQQHYDWGLRSLKSILRSSGSLLQQSKSQKDDQGGERGGRREEEGWEAESQLLIQAVHMNTVSKLATVDRLQFLRLLQDVFRGVSFAELRDEGLHAKLLDVYEEAMMQVLPTQINKSLELHEQLKQRMGVLIVGPSRSGKSTLWQQLRMALQKMGQEVKLYAVNPKAIQKTQLIGQIESESREWRDGLLTSFSRDVIKESKEVKSWVLCDGDVDPEWVESLNSVLDDNHLLTLPSGERIQFNNNVNFIFETHDLKYASPATISRMGMIFLSEEDVTMEAVIDHWLRSRQVAGRLEDWVRDYVVKCVEWIKSENDCILPFNCIHVTTTILSYLRFLDNDCDMKLFMTHLTTGACSCLQLEAKNKMAAELFGMFGESPPDFDDVLNFKYDANTSKLVKYERDTQADSSTIESNINAVMTTDTQRHLDILSKLVSMDNNQPFLLIGPDGSGKRFLLEQCLEIQSSSTSTQLSIIRCSAHTSPDHVVKKLDQLCSVMNTPGGRKFKPKSCEKLLLLLKDVNQPLVDKYATSPFLAFLTQILTYGGFYDSSLEMVTFDGVQMVFTIDSHLSDLAFVSSRFLSLVPLFSLCTPKVDQLESIYSHRLSSLLQATAAAAGGASLSFWNKSSNIELLAKATVCLYEELKRTFNYNDHAHYIFNMTHLTEWIDAIKRYNLEALSSSDSSLSRQTLINVWLQEARVKFRSRLVEEKAKRTYDEIAQTVVYNVFAGKAVVEDMEKLQYSSVVMEGAAVKKAKCLQPLSTSSLRDVMLTVTHKYGKEHGEETMAFSSDFLHLVSTMDRLMDTSGGSALVVARSGSGRKSALKLVAYMRQIDIYTPKMSKNYSVKQFKADLKQVVQTCVLENQELILLLEDHHMIDDQFYELITCFVCEGDASHLYSVDEYEAVVSTLRDQCSIDNFNGQPLQYLSMKLRKNLHTCLLLDWSNGTFVMVCKNNPALLKNLTVLWLDDWRRDSCLELVETLILNGLNKKNKKEDRITSKNKKKDVEEDGDDGDDKDEDEDDDDDDVKSKCTSKFFKLFYEIHSQLASIPDGFLDTSPRKFSTLVKTFIRLYKQKRSSIFVKRNKLKKGLEKLKDAQDHVATLKREAGEQHKELARKQKEADDSMTEITTTLSSAGNRKVEIEELQKEAGKEGQKLDKRKKAIEEELKEIEPIVNEAKRSVGNIRTETLGEIRALRAPPDTIRDILEGVMVLMGNPDTSWLAMKSFLAKRGVKEEIQNFDAHRIKPDTRKRIESFLKKNARSFDPKNAKRASEAAAPLATWVNANVKYAEILERIQPLEKEQNDLQSNISGVEHKMKKLGHGLSKVDERVKELQKKFETITKENATLKLKLDKSEEIIQSAESLVDKLTGEFQRWTAQIKELHSGLDDLHLKCLHTAAVLTYLSSCPEHTRQRLKNTWADIVSLKDFDPVKFLASENEQLQWKSEGLPADTLSIENAVVIKEGLLTPLLIDPFSQTTEWLKNHFKDNNVEVVNMRDSDLFSQVELAVKFGKTLIIDEVDERLDASLVPLMRRDLVQQGSRNIIQLGERSIDYNGNFRLLLSTRFPSLSLPSSLLSLLTLVNFTTTKAGLTNQLLAITMMNVKPEIESRKTKMVEEEEEMKQQLDSLEDSLLQQLATAKGDILENKALLESLNQTKVKASSIEKALQESIVLQESLNKERNAYLPLASNGSNLYFAVQDLHLSNNMYHFHLDSFIRLYNKLFTSGWKDLSDSGASEKQINDLVRSLMYHVFNCYSRSLFKKDCLVFATHLLYNTQTNLIKKEEWDFFIGLLTEASIASSDAGRLPDWIDQKQHSAINQLKEALPDVYRHLNLEDKGMWADFRHQAKLPSKVRQHLTPFQEVLVVKCLQPGALVPCLKDFVCSHLKFKELSPGNTNLTHVYERDMTNTEGVLFIVSNGSDPSQELEKLAKKTVGMEKFVQVALGQGQNETAIESLKACAANGDWLFLKNLHLVVAWLPTLLKEFKALKPHDNFRLWMTSEQHERFPVVFLKSCLKITIEAPAGLKKNLLRSFNFWGSDLVQKGSNRSRCNTLFCLAWFHAVIQERRSYIPQGWTKFYEFNNSDLQSGLQIIEKLFNRNDSSSISWGFIHGLFESAVYGGRVDNRYDNRVLVSFLTLIFNSNPSKSLGPLHLPSSHHYKDYIDTVESLGDNDEAGWFGLPENIDHVVKKVAADEVVAMLKRLKVAATKSCRFDRELCTEELSPVLRTWKKLYSENKLGKKKHLSAASENPIHQFIHFEYDAALSIVEHVNKSLSGIEKVLSGKQLLSEEVMAVVNNLVSVQTPPHWSSKWNGPEHPSAYMQAVVRKASCISKLAEGGWEKWLESTVRLSDLFNPESFLAAHRQLSARNMNCSIDRVKMCCEWSDSKGSKVGALRISGLKMAGCNFDGMKVAEKKKNDPVLMQISTCRITWYEKNSLNANNSNNFEGSGVEEEDEDGGDDDDDDAKNIKVPLYHDESREKVATVMEMPVQGEKSKWVQLMPALFIEG